MFLKNLEMENKYIFEIKELPKLSYNKYIKLHWAKKKEFKDAIKWLTKKYTHNLQLESGWKLNFEFFFAGRLLDTVNVFHYCKTIEDMIFKQDNKNGKICTDDIKHGEENKVILTIEKIQNS